MTKIFDSRDIKNNALKEQDKSSDIEQQPPFGDRKISNIQPRNRGGGSKTEFSKIAINMIKERNKIIIAQKLQFITNFEHAMQHLFKRSEFYSLCTNAP